MASNVPIISIDPKIARRLDIAIELRKLYYRPQGYYRTSEKLHAACKKAGNNFSLADVREWLNKQALHQIHKPRPKFIQYASFNGIQRLNQMHQSDTTPMPHDKVGKRVYKYRGVIKDVTTRYRKSFGLTDKSSAQMSKAIKKIYNDSSNPLTWPEDFRVDKGTEYMGECREMLLRRGVKISYAKSKRGVAIAERDHQEYEKQPFRRQDAVDFLLPLSERSRSWFGELDIDDNVYNNSVTSQIGMTPNEAVKKSLNGEKIFAKPSVKHRRPVGYNESLLPTHTEVRHLLETGELEGNTFGKRRATDCNWSPEVFTIESYLIKNNQPILYKLFNGPERFFVKEELQIVPKDTELPPKHILKH